MSRLDCSSAEVKAALEDVSSPTSKNEWAVFGYVPKSGNVIKVDSKGSGFEDLVEEFSEGKVQFAYYRVTIKAAAKFVYVAWCGDGVSGMAKGSFANHSNDFAAHLKKGFAVHHQLNARSEADLDEKKIQAALVKAAGANYDAGAKKQGMDSTAKAMGELKTFHISEQERAVQTGTGRDGTGVAIDKGASDAFWQANKSQPKAPAAAPSSRPAVDDEERKAFWQQQQQEQAAAKASAAKQAPQGRPAPSGNRVNAGAFNAPPSSAPPSSAPPAAGGGGRPAPGKINTSAFSNPAPPTTSAPPPGRPAPGGAPPKLPSSGPPKLPPSQPPSVSAPPPVPSHAPPTSAPPPVSRPPAAAPLPPRAPEPEADNGDDGWGDEPAAAPAQDYSSTYAAPAQEEYAAPAQEDYSQTGYAQEEYAQEEYATGGQEEYAQEEYAQEEYATGQEEYAQEEYAQEEYAQEEYAQEEYAQEGYATEGYTQVQALHDYAGSHAEDLTFKAGEWITVHERDESGWWKGELNGVSGYFPSNFVQQ